MFRFSLFTEQCLPSVSPGAGMLSVFQRHREDVERDQQSRAGVSENRCLDCDLYIVRVENLTPSDRQNMSFFCKCVCVCVW